MLPYHTGVLDSAPTGPDMILMPGGGTYSRRAGYLIEGDPVGTASEVDTDAAEELFRTTYPKLAGWVRRLVVDDDTAHEIASEAFVRLLSRWTRVESPQSYLYMIATNLIRDHWRKAERERRAMRSVSAAEALARVRIAAGEMLDEVSVFDCYSGEQVGEGRRSLALALSFRALDRTLTDADIVPVRDRIVLALGEVGGELRG